MVVRYEEVVAAFVVKAKVVGRVVLRRELLVAIRPDKVDVVIVANFLLLVVREAASVQRDGICEGSGSVQLGVADERSKPRDWSDGNGSVGSGNSNILRIVSELIPAVSFLAC